MASAPQVLEHTSPAVQFVEHVLTPALNCPIVI
jgi:hypothetical protein